MVVNGLVVLLLLPAAGSSQVRAGGSYVEHDACEGEGCGFGPMVALSPLTVYPAEAVSENVAFRIDRGEVFEALTSNLHFDPVGGVIVGEPFLLVEDYGGDTIGWANPGDTIAVLSYAGEGYYTIWFDGAKRVVRAFWDDRRQHPRPRDRPGTLVIEPEVRTWLKVRNADGKLGWLLAEPGRDFVSPDA